MFCLNDVTFVSSCAFCIFYRCVRVREIGSKHEAAKIENFENCGYCSFKLGYIPMVYMYLKTTLKADFFSSQKPLAASYQVLLSSQNNFLSSQEYDNLMNRPGWSFKQRHLNQAITITLRLTEHANIF